MAGMESEAEFLSGPRLRSFRRTVGEAGREASEVFAEAKRKILRLSKRGISINCESDGSGREEEAASFPDRPDSNFRFFPLQREALS